MAKPSNIEKVTSVTHYTDNLFSFRVTRPPSLRFKPGQFIMLGLPSDTGPIMRAYSIASGPYDDELEFYSIKIPNGPLTSRLKNIKIGDNILLSGKAVGNLTPWDILPGKRLFLFSTGTGIAPFASMLRDPETYDLFEEIILTHTCRNIQDLEYGKDMVNKVKNNILFGPEAQKKLTYVSSVTREKPMGDSVMTGRVTELIKSHQLFEDLSISNIDPTYDRAMICGSTDVVKDIGEILNSHNMRSSSGRQLREYAYERAFVG